VDAKMRIGMVLPSDPGALAMEAHAWLTDICY
jgi:hypothetical protein